MLHADHDWSCIINAEPYTIMPIKYFYSHIEINTENLIIEHSLYSVLGLYWITVVSYNEECFPTYFELKPFEIQIDQPNQSWIKSGPFNTQCTCLINPDSEFVTFSITICIAMEYTLPSAKGENISYQFIVLHLPSLIDFAWADKWYWKLTQSANHALYTYFKEHSLWTRLNNAISCGFIFKLQRAGVLEITNNLIIINSIGHIPVYIHERP